MEVLHAVPAAEVHAVVDHAAVALGVWQHGNRCGVRGLKHEEMMRG